MGQMGLGLMALVGVGIMVAGIMLPNMFVLDGPTTITDPANPSIVAHFSDLKFTFGAWKYCAKGTSIEVPPLLTVNSCVSYGGDATYDLPDNWNILRACAIIASVFAAGASASFFLQGPNASAGTVSSLLSGLFDLSVHFVHLCLVFLRFLLDLG